MLPGGPRSERICLYLGGSCWWTARTRARYARRGCRLGQPGAAAAGPLDARCGTGCGRRSSTARLSSSTVTSRAPPCPVQPTQLMDVSTQRRQQASRRRSRQPDPPCSAVAWGMSPNAGNGCRTGSGISKARRHNGSATRPSPGATDKTTARPIRGRATDSPPVRQRRTSRSFLP